MFIQAETVDDLLDDVLRKLLDVPFNIETSHGNTSEIFGVLLRLNNPLARLSRTETRGKPFSALGELLWYLTESNSLAFIEHYIPAYKKYTDENGLIYGGYGPRLFKMHGKYNQVRTIIELLKSNPNTRRAVIQIFDAQDNGKKYKEIPCTCTLQFTVRDGRLNMLTSMRSNDVFIGLPHDIFCFTMIQEIIARSIGVEIGTYFHSIGSLHLYEADKSKAENYLKEGYQSTKIKMPEMPTGDPWPAIAKILITESKIRVDEALDYEKIELDKYWLDLIYLLQIHANYKKQNYDIIKQLQKRFSDKMYETYVENKLRN